MAISKLL